MTPLFMLLGALVLLLTAGTVYSRFLARRWGEDALRVTPAIRFNDGRDYVPTPTPIVFAHHFASIAGAGPIVGPIIAATAFGLVPTFLWIVIFTCGQFFPMLIGWSQRHLGSPAGAFWFFTLVCVCATLFGWRMLPETKGRTLEEIARSWRKR